MYLMGHHTDRRPPEVMAWADDIPLLSCISNLPFRTTGNLEAMVAFAGQGVVLCDNLPNAVDRIATILLEAQAALARLKGMTL